MDLKGSHLRLIGSYLRLIDLEKKKDLVAREPEGFREAAGVLPPNAHLLCGTLAWFRVYLV